MILELTQAQPLRRTPEAKVFTPSLCARLSTLTRAERELRGMGLRVLWSNLSGERAQIHILRDAEVSIATLLNRMGPRAYRPADGYTMASGEFLGVLVSWCEPV